MKKLTIAFIIVLAFVGTTFAQANLPKSQSLLEFRPVGEIRYWTIEVKDSVIGGVTSVVSAPRTINGEQAFVFSEKLKLDYSKTGMDRIVEVVGEFLVDKNGFYLGDRKDITTNGISERIELTRDGLEISGFFTRNGQKIRQSGTIDKPSFGFDLNMYDQLEIALAMTDITVGQPIEFDLVEPQTLLSSHLSGFVEEYQYLSIHSNIRDSVFVISIFSPQPMLLLFSKDKKLLKIEIENQRTKVYLDVVRKAQTEATPRPPVTTGSIMNLIPHYLIYLLGAVLVSVLFIGSAYRFSFTYISFVLGLGAFWITTLTQIPLQQYLFTEFFIPSIQTGGSPFLAGWLPAFPAGIIQISILFSLIFFILKQFNIKSYLAPAIGALFGAGFGLMEASYSDSMSLTQAVLDLNLLERLGSIMMHIASGAILGYFISVNWSKVWFAVAVLIIINSTYRFLPVLVQTEVVPLTAMFFVVFALGLVMVLGAVLLIKQKMFRPQTEL